MDKNNTIKQDWQDVISNVGQNRLKNFNKKTILISGANGFVGRSLAYFFLYLNDNFSANIKLILVDRNFNVPHEVRHLLKKYNCKIITRNLLKKIHFNFDIDYIFHLAAIISPKINSENPVASLNVNFLGTENILNAVKGKKLKKFIYFSSAGVYGNPDEKNIPTKEDFNGNLSPVSFRSCYAEGKRTGEALTMAYSRQYGLPANIVRPTHMYGSLMNFNEDVSLNYFLSCGFSKKDIILQTKGQDTRSLCYVTDVLSIVLLVALSAESGEIFNIGNEKTEIKIIDLAKLICKIFDNGIKVKVREKNKVDFLKVSIERNNLSMKKVKDILKFVPKVDIKEGFKRTIKSHKSR